MVTSAVASTVLLTLAGTGCGQEQPSSAPTTSPAVETCRDTWRELNTEWESRADSGFPSDLAERWSALAAGGAYQLAAADKDCQDGLAKAEVRARSIERLSGSLRDYDLVWQYGEINEAATARIARARAATGQGAKAEHRTARLAQRALDRLERLAPLAASDMDAAWQAAVQADLADPEAMRDLADSMAFVANDSVPYRQGSEALEKLERLISRR